MSLDVAYKVMELMGRSDSEDTSTIMCKCGDSFTWSGCDSVGLKPWLRKHSKCYKPQTKKRGAKR